MTKVQGFNFGYFSWFAFPLFSNGHLQKLMHFFYVNKYEMFHQHNSYVQNN
jgi:hypothetical protein